MAAKTPINGAEIPPIAFPISAVVLPKPIQLKIPIFLKITGEKIERNIRNPINTYFFS